MPHSESDSVVRDAMAQMSPDESLLHRARSGDQDAFVELFERHASASAAGLKRSLHPRLRCKVSESDILQRARLVAFRGLPQFEYRGAGSIRAWISAIVQLTLRDRRKHFRAAKRNVCREREMSGVHAAERLCSRSPTPSEGAMGRERRDSINRAIGALPEDYRQVLRLHREDGVPLRRIAELMNRSEDAVKQLASRAARKLAELLRQHGIEPHGRTRRG